MSTRPYKPSWSNEETFAWLRRMARSKFDEDCVEALAFNADEVRKIQARFRDTDAGPRNTVSWACAVNDANLGCPTARKVSDEPPEVEVVIEVPRGSFLKRGSTGHIDFVSPLPCPFNYGSVPGYLGLEGDLLDALVLGPRLPYGTRTRIRAWGAVTLTDRGMSDDKLVCSDHAPTPRERERVLRFFRFYAKCKGLLNLWRHRPGRNACDGWCEADQAIARATPRDDAWHGPRIGF